MSDRKSGTLTVLKRKAFSPKKEKLYVPRQEIYLACVAFVNKISQSRKGT